MDAVFVGIDVSKERLDVHVEPSGEAFSVARNGEGLAALSTRLSGRGALAIAVEATGGFESVVVACLAGAGLPVVVVNPAQVRAFAQALGQRAKTDPIEARRSSPLSATGSRSASCTPPSSQTRRWPPWRPGAAN